MTTLVGTHLVCKFTLWLYVSGLKRKLPHVGEFICRVEKYDKSSYTDLEYVYVDCKKSIAWLKSDHPNSFWWPLAGPSELTGHNCHE